MKANKMKSNGTIGIFCPSHIANFDRYERVRKNIEQLGYKVVFGENMYKDTFGFVASAKERASDLNSLVSNKEVELILFSGGNGAVDILPYIDYKNIRENPKLFSTYSDGTSILNAIHSQTGLITYYGFGTDQFEDLHHYDYSQFCQHFVNGYSSNKFVSNSSWLTLNDGMCEGILIGGYLSLFGLMISNKYFNFNKSSKYILFLEDHERYSTVGGVSTYLSFIEQSSFMEHVTGLMFGHYSANPPMNLEKLLERFGKRNGIPVIYTDDFGHGPKHAILPIGTKAKLDANNHILDFCDND